MEQTLLDRIIELAGRLAVAEQLNSIAEAEIANLKMGPQAAPRDVVEMLQAMAEGKKIEAIKYCRTLTGYGLKEAKDMIEAAWAPQVAAPTR